MGPLRRKLPPRPTRPCFPPPTQTLATHRLPRVGAASPVASQDEDDAQASGGGVRQQLIERLQCDVVVLA